MIKIFDKKIYISNLHVFCLIGIQLELKIRHSCVK